MPKKKQKRKANNSDKQRRQRQSKAACGFELVENSWGGSSYTPSVKIKMKHLRRAEQQ